MRSRLLITVLSLLVLVLLGLGLPFAVTLASSEQQQLFFKRQADTAWLASRATQPVSEGTQGSLDQLRADLRRYDELKSVPTAVYDLAGEVVAASRGGFTRAGLMGEEEAASRWARALAGLPSEPYPLLLPWDTRSMALAEPIRIGGEVRAALITFSPTTSMRHTVLREWIGLSLMGLVVLALGAVLFAVPVVGWILRPVRGLDRATVRVADRVSRGHPVEEVGAASGPPELRHLTRSFNRMATTLSNAMAAQRAFVADASHQLRNRLTALRLRLSNLDGHVDEEAANQHVAATEEVERLSEVLQDLLALARAEAGAERTDVVDVDSVVEDQIHAWETVAESRGVELRRTGTEGLAVLAPHGVLETALDALVDNAVKFTEAGTEVEVAVRRAGEQVVMSVRDHGPGLRPEELSKATSRFWRAPAHQNIPGTGLGLSIVRVLAERAGGSLWLDLPDGGGLRVEVRLPLTETR